ncbi:RNA polymerase I specific transcription initiation factor RRN3 [Carpediemonas membranifera]|uniref:RNA polymerase I specific transcription initiation factor RRN3 n=1 Tax=Carpediemonas membranifera TaxID=201153 RepID=A0A8J6BVH5_9EUKA|nr:RNA polymerase I specific transcription initiation factor RRN3 [Carpediemonas membranifera]|eukprot:KAG9391416.1 RNA polymerase I specific transcription initiation factor RRN3 [Carpediemonas membranifera]
MVEPHRIRSSLTIAISKSNAQSDEFKATTDMYAMLCDTSKFNTTTMTYMLANWPERSISQFYEGVKDCIAAVAAERPDIIPPIVEMPYWKYSDPAMLLFYQQSLTTLVSAHSSFAGTVVSHVIGHGFLIPEAQHFAHSVLRCLMKTNPDAFTHSVVHVVNSAMPGVHSDAEQHVSFISAMLAMCEYAPQWEADVIDCIFNSLILVDVEIKPELLEDLEEEPSPSSAQDMSMRGQSVQEGRFVSSHEAFSPPHKILADTGARPDASAFVIEMADRLDRCLMVVMDWMERQARGDPARAIALFENTLPGFVRRVLRTYRSKYVQFAMFYLCSLCPGDLCSMFLVRLFQTILDHSLDVSVRQCASYYVGSFVARATFVPDRAVHMIAEMLLDYLMAEEVAPDAIPDVFSHPMFYTICQTIFYIACFHPDTLLCPQMTALFGPDGQMQSVIESPLKPLSVCFEPIVDQFIDLCASRNMLSPDIEHILTRDKAFTFHNFGMTSSRVKQELIETFFPFDPFQLAQGSRLIDPIYREWDDHAEYESE